MTMSLCALLFAFVLVAISAADDAEKCISVQQGHKSILSIGPLASRVLLLTTDFDLFDQNADMLTAKHLALATAVDLHSKWSALYDKLKEESVDSSANLISVQNDKLLFVSSKQKSFWLFDSTKNSITEFTNVTLDKIPAANPEAWTNVDSANRLHIFGGYQFVSCSIQMDSSSVEVNNCQSRFLCPADNGGEDKVSVKTKCTGSPVVWSGSIVKAFLAMDKAYLLTKEANVYIVDQSALVASTEAETAVTKITLQRFIKCQGGGGGNDDDDDPRENASLTSKGLSTTWLVLIILGVLLVVCLIILWVCRSSHHHKNHAKPHSSKKGSSRASSGVGRSGHSKHRSSSKAGHSKGSRHSASARHKASKLKAGSKLAAKQPTVLKAATEDCKKKSKYGGGTFASKVRANSSTLKDIPTRWDTK